MTSSKDNNIAPDLGGLRKTVSVDAATTYQPDDTGGMAAGPELRPAEGNSGNRSTSPAASLATQTDKQLETAAGDWADARFPKPPRSHVWVAVSDAFIAGAKWWYENARWTQEEIDAAKVRGADLAKRLGVEAAPTVTSEAADAWIDFEKSLEGRTDYVASFYFMEGFKLARQAPADYAKGYADAIREATMLLGQRASDWDTMNPDPSDVIRGKQVEATACAKAVSEMATDVTRPDDKKEVTP